MLYYVMPCCVMLCYVMLCYVMSCHVMSCHIISYYISHQSLTLTLQWRIMGAIASQITSLTIVYSAVYSDTDQRKHQSSASLAFVWGIHRSPVNSPHQWTVTRKMFPFDDVIMKYHWNTITRKTGISTLYTVNILDTDNTATYRAMPVMVLAYFPLIFCCQQWKGFKMKSIWILVNNPICMYWL